MADAKIRELTPEIIGTILHILPPNDTIVEITEVVIGDVRYLPTTVTVTIDPSKAPPLDIPF